MSVLKRLRGNFYREKLMKQLCLLQNVQNLLNFIHFSSEVLQKVWYVVIKYYIDTSFFSIVSTSLLMSVLVVKRQFLSRETYEAIMPLI